MQKWTSQQKLLSLSGIVGAPIIIGLTYAAIKIGPDNALKILDLAAKVGPKTAINVLQKAQRVIDIAA